MSNSGEVNIEEQQSGDDLAGGSLFDVNTRELCLAGGAEDGGSTIYEVVRPTDQIPWHRLDYRVSWLLRHLDGERSAEELVAISGLEIGDAETLLAELVDEGWIRAR